jgi:hypothetical protein
LFFSIIICKTHDEDPFRFTLHTQYLVEPVESEEESEHEEKCEHEEESKSHSVEESHYGEAIEYEVLLYAWGKEECSRKVLFDEVPLPITSNLDRALRRLRYHDRSCMLWIDTMHMRTTIQE